MEGRLIDGWDESINRWIVSWRSAWLGRWWRMFSVCVCLCVSESLYFVRKTYFFLHVYLFSCFNFNQVTRKSVLWFLREPSDKEEEDTTSFMEKIWFIQKQAESHHHRYSSFVLFQHILSSTILYDKDPLLDAHPAKMLPSFYSQILDGSKETVLR